MMNKNIKNIMAMCLFGVLMSLETVAEYHSNGTPKIVKTYKIQSNKLVLDKEQEFYSNGVMKVETKYRNGEFDKKQEFYSNGVIKFETKYRNGEAHSFNSWDKTGKPFKINLREYYFPIDKFIDNPQVYIYEDLSRRIKDIIKCETLIDGNRDTIFTATFYSDLNSPGFEWKEKCTSKGILNMSSPEYKMINSPLFNYEQDLGDKSQASYFFDSMEIYWERTLYDTVSWRNNENLIDYLEDVPERLYKDNVSERLYKDIQELDLVVYSDSFKENNETIDHWGRDLFYSKGIGRVAVEYYNGLTIFLREIVDLETFEEMRKGPGLDAIDGGWEYSGVVSSQGYEFGYYEEEIWFDITPYDEYYSEAKTVEGRKNSDGTIKIDKLLKEDLPEDLRVICDRCDNRNVFKIELQAESGWMDKYEWYIVFTSHDQFLLINNSEIEYIIYNRTDGW